MIRTGLSFWFGIIDNRSYEVIRFVYFIISVTQVRFIEETEADIVSVTNDDISIKLKHYALQLKNLIQSKT